MPSVVTPKVSKVVVHPLVLLSVVDHFNRMDKVGNVKRVVGVLLGSNRTGQLDVSNSFAGNTLVLFNLYLLLVNLLQLVPCIVRNQAFLMWSLDSGVLTSKDVKGILLLVV